MVLFFIISEIKRDIGRKSSFCHTPLHLTPPLEGFPSEYCHTVWYGKTKMAWLPDGERFWRYVYSFSQDPRTWRTDTQTDTTWRHRPRLCIASRGKKYLHILILPPVWLRRQTTAAINVLRPSSHRRCCQQSSTAATCWSHSSSVVLLTHVIWCDRSLTKMRKSKGRRVSFSSRGDSFVPLMFDFSKQEK